MQKNDTEDGAISAHLVRNYCRWGTVIFNENIVNVWDSVGSAP